MKLNNKKPKILLAVVILLIVILLAIWLWTQKNTTPKQIINTYGMTIEEYEHLKNELLEEGVREDELNNAIEAIMEVEVDTFEDEYPGHIYNSILKFMNYIENKDFEEAYSLLSDDFKTAEMGSIEKFKKYCEENFITSKGIKELVVYEDKKINNVMFNSRAELINPVNSSISKEYFTVNFLSGAKDVTNFSLAFKKFIQTIAINKNYDITRDINITVDKIDRYIDKVNVYVTITNDSESKFSILNVENNEILKGDNGWNNNIYCVCEKNGKSDNYSLILEDMENAKQYFKIFKVNSTTKKLTFNIPIDVQINKFVLSNVILNENEIKKVEIDLKK